MCLCIYEYFCIFIKICLYNIYYIQLYIGISIYKIKSTLLLKAVRMLLLYLSICTQKSVKAIYMYICICIYREKVVRCLTGNEASSARQVMFQKSLLLMPGAVFLNTTIIFLYIYLNTYIQGDS